MYAIIATGGKQYKVSVGDKVKVEKIEAEVGQTVTFDQVLMVSASEVTVGTPCVEGAAVEGEVTDQGKNRKVIVYKYKPKTGYHKKNGHRQMFTEVVINKILLNGEEIEDAAEEEPAVEEAVVEEVAEVAEEAVEEVTEAAEEAVEEAEEAVEVAEEAVEVAEEAVEAAEEVAEDE